MTTFADMVYSLGGVPAVSGLPLTLGDVYYVSSGSGSSANSGKTPEQPKATIDQAINLCTASQGDIIVVMPGHAETISGATSLVMDVAGVHVIGLGRGSLRPTLTYSATASIISITAANCTLENLVLVGAKDDIVTGISLGAGADGTTLKDIEMKDGAANKEFLIGIAIAAGCTDVTIDGLRYYGFPGGGASNCILCAGNADRLKLLNSYINGDFSASVLDALTAASTDVLIANNTVINIDTTAGLGLGVKSDTTGFFVRNNVMNLKDNVVGVVGAAMGFCENYCTNAAGASGIIKPTVDS